MTRQEMFNEIERELNQQSSIAVFFEKLPGQIMGTDCLSEAVWELANNDRDFSNYAYECYKKFHEKFSEHEEPLPFTISWEFPVPELEDALFIQNDNGRTITYFEFEKHALHLDEIEQWLAEVGTDADFDRYSVEVQNRDGYYDSFGKFHWYYREDD